MPRDAMAQGHHEIVGYFNVRSSWSVAMQVLVVGAGVVGLGIARAVARAGHEVIVAEAESGDRHRHLVAQQRSDPCRASTIRPTRCARATARAAAACSTRIAPSTASRTARCGKLVVATNDNELEQARRDLQAGADQRLRERRADRRRGGEEARAGRVLRRRDELAGDRHHRQPQLHAGAARRDRGSRRHDRAQHAHRAAGADAGRLGGAFRRRRDDRGRCRGQCRRPRRAEARARDRRLSAGAGAEARARQGQLFQLCRAGRCSSGWSIRRRFPAGSASMSCSTSPAACASGPTSSGSSDENYDVDPRRADVFYAAHPRHTGRACRTTRWSRTMPASGRRSAGRASRRSISSSTRPRTTACRGWCMLFGIELPGLTASLSIGEEVAGYLSS